LWDFFFCYVENKLSGGEIPLKEKEKEETHFVRNPEFKAAAEKLQGPLWQIFVEFLERSCTAEFSEPNSNAKKKKTTSNHLILLFFLKGTLVENSFFQL
jgi:hypothetical protein